jgi:hypothetical protein
MLVTFDARSDPIAVGNPGIAMAAYSVIASCGVRMLTGPIETDLYL